jgi:uncharacterized Fe-S center protein
MGIFFLSLFLKKINQQPTQSPQECKCLNIISVEPSGGLEYIGTEERGEKENQKGQCYDACSACVNEEFRRKACEELIKMMINLKT